MEQPHGSELPPAAQAPSASSIARAFNKRLLKVQLLHELHHEEPMELGEATRLTRASSGGASDACMHHHVLRRLLERSSSSSASLTSGDILGLLSSSFISSRPPSFFSRATGAATMSD